MALMSGGNLRQQDHQMESRFASVKTMPKEMVTTFEGSPGRFRTVVTDALSIPDIRPRQLERSPTFPAT